MRTTYDLTLRAMRLDWPRVTRRRVLLTPQQVAVWRQTLTPPDTARSVGYMGA